MADYHDRDARVLMNNRLDEHLISATITDIEWERIHMHLTVNVDYSDRFDPTKPLDFYLVAAFLMANAKYKAEQLDEHTYRLSLNVTNTGAVMCVPTGTYTIYACQGTDILCAPEVVSTSLSPKTKRTSASSSTSWTSRSPASKSSISMTARKTTRRAWQNSKRASINAMSKPDAGS